MANNPEYYAEKLQDHSISNLHALLEEICQDNDPNMMEMIWKYIITGNRWGKILFIKLLKDKKDTNIISPLRFFLEEIDPLLNILAVDLLSTMNVPGRVDLFFDLLKHPEVEVMIAAIHFFGEEKMMSAVTPLRRLYLEKTTSDIMKKEIKSSLKKITLKPLVSLGIMEEKSENNE